MKAFFFLLMDRWTHLKVLCYRRQEFLELLKNNKKVIWGYADGTGDPIELNIHAIF